MKRTLPLAALALLALGPAASAIEVDGLAAKVGDDAILKSDVLMEMSRRRANASDYTSVRNEMIEKKLILRAAKAAKMTMQDWIVENRVREIIARAFDGDRNKLLETLAQQKVSYPEWLARMKDDMVVGAMRWHVVDKNARARPGDLKREYEENPTRYALPGKVTVSVILLPPEAATNRTVVSAALATNDFADVARRFSADSHASAGGVWKDIEPRDVFKPEICDEIAQMPLNTISRWIELDGWSFLLRKDAETRGAMRSFEEAYDEIERNVREREAQKAYDDWIERLKAETYIHIY